MKFTEDEASVDLTNLLLHTVKKFLLRTNKEEWKNLPKRMTLGGARGMDGTGNQQSTRQPWNNQSSPEDDESESESDDHLVEMREILGDCIAQQTDQKLKLRNPTKLFLLFHLKFVSFYRFS